MRLGMDVARLNFSTAHTTITRTASSACARPQKKKDAPSAFSRTYKAQNPHGNLAGHAPVTLKANSRVTITPRDIDGTAELISTTFKSLAREVKPGARILLSDGLIELRVVSVRRNDVVCEVVNGGLLGEHKGINLLELLSPFRH